VFNFLKGDFMKKLLMVALISLSAVALFAQGAKETTPASVEDFNITIKMSHVFAPNEQLTKSLQVVVDNIRDRTKGAVDIQQYPQGQLATYKDGVEQVALGANFISVEDPTYIGDYVPNFKALVAPMLYSNFDQYESVIESDLVKGWEKELEEKHNIKVLSLDYIFGFRSMMTNSVIKTPSDMKGLKIRVPGSQMFIDTINAMGATSTPIPFSETISAVQQGVVDGLEGTVDAYGSNGSSEVAKNMALTNHFLGVCGVYINSDVFNTIPAEYQAIIEEEFTAGATSMVNLISSNYDKQVAALEAKGIMFNEVDHAAFAEACKPVYESLTGVDDDAIALLQAQIAMVK
jgi:TRAP-type C4-dicarboxylate transport system substrate-binding protein